jgi:hypothetical protein
VEFKHGLGGFIWDFDAGRYPELLHRPVGHGRVGGITPSSD